MRDVKFDLPQSIPKVLNAGRIPFAARESHIAVVLLSANFDALHVVRRQVLNTHKNANLSGVPPPPKRDLLRLKMACSDDAFCTTL